jgi:hypothetical protein
MKVGIVKGVKGADLTRRRIGEGRLDFGKGSVWVFEMMVRNHERPLGEYESTDRNIHGCKDSKASISGVLDGETIETREDGMRWGDRGFEKVIHWNRI